METWLVPLLVSVVVVLIVLLVHSRIEMEQRAARRLETWRERELEDRARELHERWTLEEVPEVRKDAVARSRAVVTGKVTEHLAPYLGDFPFDPQDARFLGAPIDFVVFDGLSAGELRRVVLVEVKSGPSAALSARERAVRDCVEDGRVDWYELRRP